jgi:FlaA1/EpsC-like NDP-sugar epimerase
VSRLPSWSDFRRKIHSSTEGPRWRTWLLQLALVELALVTAFFLRFDFAVPTAMKLPLLWAIVAWAAVKMPVSRCFGLHLRLWRYFSTPDLRRLAASNVAGSLGAGVLVAVACPYSFPRSVIAIDFFLVTLFTAGAGVIARLLAENHATNAAGKQIRTLIFGAGAAGLLLLRESRQNSSFGHRICGFVDDDEAKRGGVIQGIPVLGAGADLKSIVRHYNIQEVLIALPSARGPQMRRVVELCRTAGVAFRTMPAMSEMISSKGLGKQLREVALEDLLGRSAIQMDRQEMAHKLQNRIALVTGAAGSIGSELCRQIAACRPAALVAFDMSESALFHIECEIRKDYPGLDFYAEIGSAQNRQRLSDICAEYRPHIVYHAAAYKHVPMMEANVFEAVENNVAGTFNIATVAREYGVEELVMISTDKAVRPTSIMGATKRISELIVRSFQEPGSRYVSVRFGNVLGSNGSVIPIFKNQIAAGGPVTVTHPDMHRYFMTIPEAVQLVLQASAMGKGSEIFVLDMGAPVSIVDLARQLILLSGLKPDEDICIEFTGTRPGEKLYEELTLADEEVQLTHHPKIKVFAGASVSQEWMVGRLTALGAACARRDLGALVEEIQRIVPDYTVSQDVLARIQSLGARRPASRTSAREAQTSEQRQRLWEQSLDHLREALAPLQERPEPVFDTARSRA